MKRRIIGLFLSMVVLPVQAALFERDWEYAAAGNSQITFDSSTELEWLDLTVTATLSKEDVLILLSTDPRYSSFRYATIAEWQGLVTSGGVSLNLVGGAYSTALYAPVSGLMEKLGTTYVVAGDNNATQGMLADQYGLANVRRTYMEVRHDMGDVARVIDNWSVPVWEHYEQIGSYLVRTAAPIPEPSVLVMLLSGLGALLLVTKRERKREP